MKSLLSVCVAAALVASQATSQLSGVYSIDAATPTGGGNYQTFAAAAADLAAFGVSGPVQFIVVPNAVPYAGFSIVGAIAGASATNTVEFLGFGVASMAGVATSYTQVVHLGPNAVNNFTGPSYVTIDGFDITVPATGAGVMFVGTTNCVVRNCHVHGSNTGAGIAFVSANNCTAEGNEVNNVAATPGTPGSTTYSGGISVYYLGSGCVITRNKVHDCTQQGIFVGTSGSTTAPSNVTVTNNFVWACAGAGTYPGGIAIRRTGGSTFANNSVYMTSGATPGIHMMGATTDPQPIEISNNIVKHDGTGACFRLESATTPTATTFDYNLYDPAPTAFVGATSTTVFYATLPLWQAVTNVAGKELNTLAAPAGFVLANDLHVTPGSAAFNTGSTVAGLSTDIDGDPRPMSGIPDRGADETSGAGLFAAFSAAPVSGAAPLTVAFTDQTFSTAPGGVTSWAWDFDNDGFDDAFTQNPSFTYLCPGVYTVRLTALDGVNPPSTLVRANLITVAPQPFQMTTTGGGTGDLLITPVPTTCYPTATEGWTLMSFSTYAGPVGTGPFAGLFPDTYTIAFATSAAAVGNPLHFIPAPGFFPNAPYYLPPGSLSVLAGLGVDACEVLIDPAWTFLRITNVVRITL